MEKQYFYKEIEELIVELHQLFQNLIVDGYPQAANAVNTATDILAISATMIAMKNMKSKLNYNIKDELEKLSSMIDQYNDDTDSICYWEIQDKIEDIIKSLK